MIETFAYRGYEYNILFHILEMRNFLQNANLATVGNMDCRRIKQEAQEFIRAQIRYKSIIRSNDFIL